MNDKPVIQITPAKVIELDTITIYDYDESHLIYKGLDLGSFVELCKMKKENKKLKKEVEIKHDGFMASIDDVCEYAKENDKLRSVIDNAINYLENTTMVANSYYHQRECLLNILKMGGKINGFMDKKPR